MRPFLKDFVERREDYYPATNDPQEYKISNQKQNSFADSLIIMTWDLWGSWVVCEISWKCKDVHRTWKNKIKVW